MHRTKILAVREVLTPVEDGVMFHKELDLACGHVSKPNSIYTYTVGADWKCYAEDK